MEQLGIALSGSTTQQSPGASIDHQRLQFHTQLVGFGGFPTAASPALRESFLRRDVSLTNHTDIAKHCRASLYHFQASDTIREPDRLPLYTLWVYERRYARALQRPRAAPCGRHKRSSSHLPFTALQLRRDLQMSCG